MYTLVTYGQVEQFEQILKYNVFFLVIQSCVWHFSVPQIASDVEYRIVMLTSNSRSAWCYYCYVRLHYCDISHSTKAMLMSNNICDYLWYWHCLQTPRLSFYAVLWLVFTWYPYPWSPVEITPVLTTCLWILPLCALLLCSMTHYDITMGHDVVRNAPLWHNNGWQRY